MSRSKACRADPQFLARSFEEYDSYLSTSRNVDSVTSAQLHIWPHLARGSCRRYIGDITSDQIDECNIRTLAKYSAANQSK